MHKTKSLNKTFNHNFFLLIFAFYLIFPAKTKALQNSNRIIIVISPDVNFTDNSILKLKTIFPITPFSHIISKPDSNDNKIVELREKNRDALNLYYSNELNKAEQVFDEILTELLNAIDTGPVPSDLITECIAYKILILKAKGKHIDTPDFFNKAGQYLDSSIVTHLELPPNGIEFINEMTKNQQAKKVKLYINNNESNSNCNITINQKVIHPVPELVSLPENAINWISSRCENNYGWAWKISNNIFPGATLFLSPLLESSCNISFFPIIICPEVTDMLFNIIRNFLEYAEIKEVLIARPINNQIENGLFISNISPQDKGNLTKGSLKWKTVYWGEGNSHIIKIKKRSKKKLLKIPLCFGISSVISGGLSLGLGIEAMKIDQKKYIIQDAWEREENNKQYHLLKYTSIAMAVTSGLTGLLSIITFIIKRKVEEMNTYYSFTNNKEN